MSKKKIILSSIVISIFLLCGICSFAYFTKTIDNTHNVSSTLTDKVEVVNNATEFYSAVQYYDDSKNDEYNSDETVISRRKTIQLSNNIKLYNDVLVTADCHINLNGYTIDLNGYNIVFKYQFEGTFTVYSNPSTSTDEEGNVITGSIIDSSAGTKVTDGDGNETTVKGKIIVDTPNACVTFDESIVSDDAIVIQTASAKQVVNSAMKLVFSNIQNGNLNDFYTTIDDVEDLGVDNCFIENHTNKSCVYTNGDLDLIYNYFAYKGLTITYKSGLTTTLTNGGKVLGNITETETVPLTITISYNGEELKKVVDVHIVAKADYDKAAISVLLDYMNNFCDKNSGKYIVDRAILLPKYNSYFGTKYSYSVVPKSMSDPTNYPTYDPETSTFNDYFDGTQYGDYVVTTLTSAVDGLIIKSGDSATQQIGITGTITNTTNDNHAYAAKIAMDLFGNQIIIYQDKTQSGNAYIKYELLTNPLLDGYEYTKLYKIDYRVKCNEGTYTISELNKDLDLDNVSDFKLLKVQDNASVLPYLGQEAELIMCFYFNEDGSDEDQIPDVIEIPIPIVYKIPDSGDGFAGFAPYYVYFNKQFEIETNNFTYNSFSIPVSLDGKYPSYGFIVYEKVVNADGTVAYNYVTNSEIQTKERRLLTITAPTNGYTSFDGTTQMSVSIDPYYINKEDTEYYFLYVPVWIDTEGIVYYYYDSGDKDIISIGQLDTMIDFINTANAIEEYEYKSILTIPGIVRYQCSDSVITEEFADKEMYKIAYELINGYDTYGEGKFILSSSLGTYIEKVDFSNSTNNLLTKYKYTLSLSTPDTNGNVIDTANQINSLKGINLLTGINELTFAGTNLGANTNFVTNLGYVSQITNLTKLDLSNTGIYNHTGTTIGFPTGDNELLTTLSKLEKLEQLDLSNKVDENGEIVTGLPRNQIYDFSALMDFISLENVNVTANTIVYTGTFSTILEPIINMIYGTNGALNAATFATLGANGVNVVGAGETGSDPNFNAIIKALRSLEYQDKVDGDVNLADTILKEFNAKNSYEFGINSQFTVSSESRNVNFVLNSIQFTETSEGFTMTITYDWSVWVLLDSESGTIVFTQEYKVTRY